MKNILIFLLLIAAGNFALAQDYDKVYPAENGFTPVKKDNKYGFLDASGEEVVPLVYDGLRNFSSNGWAVVKQNNQFGIIDGKNTIVVPIEYGWISPQDEFERYVIEKDDQYGLMDFSGKEIIPLSWALISNFGGGGLSPAQKEKDGNCVLIDVNGITKTKREYAYIYKYENGFAAYRKDFEDFSRYGFLDEQGKEMSSEFFEIRAFTKDGIARVIQNGLSQYIDKTGEYISNGSFETGTDFENGFATVSNNGRAGVIDKSGKVEWEALPEPVVAEVKPVVKPAPVKPKPAPEKQARFVEFKGSDGKFGVKSQNGTTIIPAKYEKVSLTWHDDYIGIEIDGKWGVANDEGKVQIAPRFDNIHALRGNMAVVSEIYPDGKKRYGYVKIKPNENAAWLIVQTIYDDARDYAEWINTGYYFAVVKLDGKYGYLGEDGIQASALTFDSQIFIPQPPNKGRFASPAGSDESVHVTHKGNGNLNFDFKSGDRTWGDYLDGKMSGPNGAFYVYNGSGKVMRVYGEAERLKTGVNIAPGLTKKFKLAEGQLFYYEPNDPDNVQTLADLKPSHHGMVLYIKP